MRQQKLVFKVNLEVHVINPSFASPLPQLPNRMIILRRWRKRIVPRP